jgi:hypothetical protein
VSHHSLPLAESIQLHYYLVYSENTLTYRLSTNDEFD